MVPEFGYASVAGMVRTALNEHRSFLDIAIERGLLGQKDVHSLMRRAAVESTSTESTRETKRNSGRRIRIAHVLLGRFRLRRRIVFLWWRERPTA
ncbi:hypothetical protein [Bradyrhizobium sp. CCGUVB1N3]|uniref:hypothetical protein n=1 Tax=Bradyrhizobium sp. CCGUVB1N3 TaxID=2949629 RepID=UPI003531CB49